ATSLPFYRVSFDPSVPSTEVFNSSVDSLSIEIAKFFGNKTAKQYKNSLIDARKRGSRYVVISKRLLNYHEKKKVEKWPVFRLGRFKGGVIFEKVDQRFKPFEDLSDRTVGFINENNRGAGLEYSFNDQLSGTDGEAMYQKISGGNWKPVFDGSEIRTEDGLNIKTTIDINLQDVAETALRRSLMEHNADYGLVMVMEVKTGAIKAISNLTHKGDKYIETYNYAVGGSFEPGSTIKLATMLALLEDTNINLNDSIDTGDGVYKIYDNRVRDHHEGGWGVLSIKDAFAKSSNVAIVKLVEKYYGLTPEKFVDHFDKLKLTTPLQFQIKGGAEPKVTRPGQTGWSGITLPWMAHGYGMETTPLHIITLYNAIANNGKMIKPYIVSSVNQTEYARSEFETEVLNDKICSDETLRKLKFMLEEVVENGTASNIKGTHYKIAGKTGTTQILEDGRYSARYITSFAGYFPASNPRYTALVVIRNPKGWKQYGSNVAAPVFKEIADNIYARDLEMHKPYENDLSKQVTGVFPVIRAGNAEDIKRICNTIGVSNHIKTESAWAKARIKGNAVVLVDNKIQPEIVPDVTGMTLRDALFLLETAGLRVVYSGRGRVESQSIIPGTKITGNSTIKLSLII
ncbi:MAG: transpeptidase family protein, partial [Cyclobacteriaceae bacterium]|nr:transpeptidase family protein [Cyclobacteriaceae bacterium]